MRALTAAECIHAPCLSFQGTHLTTNLSCPLLSYGCDCLVASFPICLTCLCTVYRSIAHGILIRLPPARSRHYESHPQGAEWVDRNVYSCPNPLTQMKSQMRSFNSVAGTRSQSLVRIVVRHAVCGSVTTSSLDLLQHAR
jgi:hypothetical protein